MKIVVISDTRQPSTRDNAHGLGRMAIDLCDALKARKHDVTLWAGAGSMWDSVFIHESEKQRLELTLDDETVYVDLSHLHLLSEKHPDKKVIDWIVDGECLHIPHNVIVSTAYDKTWYPHAMVVPCGINIDTLPFCEHPSQEYLAFCAKIHARKGFHDALRVHQAQDLPVKFVGERWADDWLPDWKPHLSGKAYCDFVGNALGLLHPVNHRQQLGGGRMPLEAAAMGTPAIVYDYVSTRDHVEHGVTGWIVDGLAEMVDAVQDLPLIDRKKCREWVADTHSLELMAQGVESAIDAMYSKVGV